MTNNQVKNHAYYTKVAWGIYALIVMALIAVLLLFVASDNEELVFFGLMTPAAAYVFRPTSRYMNRHIFKFTGVSQPTEDESTAD